MEYYKVGISPLITFKNKIQLGGNINQYKLIVGEGKVGTYGELLKSGRRGDNLTECREKSPSKNTIKRVAF